MAYRVKKKSRWVHLTWDDYGDCRAFTQRPKWGKGYDRWGLFHADEHWHDARGSSGSPMCFAFRLRPARTVLRARFIDGGIEFEE